MAKYDTHTLEVCRDCMEYVAYGDENLDPMLELDDHDKWLALLSIVSKAQAEYEVENNCYLSEGNAADQGFTFTPCELCKRPLGGSRYEITAISR